MPKGKPWNRKDEKQLIDLARAKYPLPDIAKKLGKSKEAVRQKILRLGLEVEQPRASTCSTTSSVKLPEELFSVEDALKMLAGALKKACELGLDKTDIYRLQVTGNLARTYIDGFAKFVDYAGIERHLQELDKKLELLTNAK